MQKYKYIYLSLAFGLLLTTGAHAGQQIVTIYFAGTSADFQWSSPHKTTWKNHEELLATMFSEHRVPAPYHKWFVDGIGSGCSDLLGPVLGDISGGLANFFGSGFPGLNICRGWQTNLTDATDFLNSVIERYPDDDILLNLVGWSRGGALALWFASQQESNPGVSKINILAIDPVIGDLIEMWNADHYTLGNKVAHYVGLYAEHERSYMFGPTLPDKQSEETRTWLLRLPGSHETLVGNLQKTGHSLITACYLLGPDCPLPLFQTSLPATDPELEVVYWVTKVFAQELLGSYQWGGVQFDWNWHEEANLQNKRELFAEKVDVMWTLNRYNYMRNFAFTPLGLEDFFLSGCVPEATGQGSDRCSIDYSSGSVVPASSLNNSSQRLSIENWDNLPRNHLPAANAGIDQVIVADDQCTAEVTLDASGSSDPDGDELTYSWSWNNGLNTAGGATPTLLLRQGNHTISLVVSDGIENSPPDTVSIIVQDRSAPAITVDAHPDILSPVNGNFRKINLNISTSDNCDTAPAVVLADIKLGKYSFSQYNRPGWLTSYIKGADIGTDDNSIYLRAARYKRFWWFWTDPVYTITYTATDASGNTGEASATVKVRNTNRFWFFYRNR